MKIVQRLRHLLIAPIEFPWPMFASAIVTILSLVLVHNGVTDKENLATLAWAVSASVPWLVGIAFTVRASDMPHWNVHLFSAIAMIACVGIIFHAPSATYPALFMQAAGLLYLAVAPYVRRGAAYVTEPCHYQLALALSFVFTGLSVLIFCLGIDAILVSLRYLFEIQWPDRIYFDVWVIGTGVLGMAWFIASIVNAHRDGSGSTAYPRWAYFIVTYLLVPLLAAYLIILYAYGIKIMLLAELPKGRLGLMISLFGVIGAFTHYLARPLSEHGRRILGFVDRSFYPALIAPLILFWYAIAKRIGEYGITEDRYVLIIIALWLSFLVAAHLARRLNMALWTPLSAVVLLVVASIGPWSANAVSTRSQLHELRGLLTQAGVLHNGTVTPHAEQDKDVPTELQARIANIVQYFTNSKKIDALDPLMLAQPSNQNRWELTRFVMMQWGLSPMDGARDGNTSRFGYYHRQELNQLLDTQGYWYFLPNGTQYFGSSSTEERDDSIKDSTGAERLHVRVSRTQLQVSDVQGRTVNFDLAPIAEQLVKTLGSESEIKPEHEALINREAEKDGLKVRLQITNMNVALEGKNPRIESIGYQLFVTD